VSARIAFARWCRVAVVAAAAGALIAAAAPSADAAAHAARPVKHHGRHHGRHHAKRHGRLRKRHRAGHQTAQQSAAVPLQPCANADTPATSASLDAMRAAVVCLINQQRVERGLPALRVSAKLNASAQSWNSSMVASGDFSHGSDFAGRISAVGYDWQTAGENIATGYPTARAVVDGWMASTDHCRNILDPSFEDVGTGETPAPVGNWGGGPATWTQDFGLLMSDSPPSGNQRPQNGCPY